MRTENLIIREGDIVLTEQINILVQNHPIYIPVAEAAAFLHMAPEALRASMEQNRCPFGFSWKLGNRAGYNIPTIAFVNWLTKGAYAA